MRLTILATALATLFPRVASSTEVGLPTRATISGDGNVIAFVASRDGRTVGGPVYHYDRTTERLTLVTVGPSGQPVESNVSETPSLSADGGKIFIEGCFGLTVDAPASPSVCVHDLVTRTTTLVGRNNSDNLVTSFRGAISSDGQVVAFGATGNVTADDMNPTFIQDVFQRRIGSGPTILVSRDDVGTQRGSTTGLPVLSSDGQLVAFSFFNGSGVGNSIFVRDTVGGTSDLATIAQHTGMEINASQTFFGDMSSTGRFVVFATSGSAVSDDNDLRRDIYLRDRQLGVTELISRDTGGLTAAGDSFTPFVSSDGRYVAFSSIASTLVVGDSNGFNDVFVRDRMNQTTVRASVSSQGVQADDFNDLAGMSDDGRFVLIRSQAANLAAGGQRCVASGGLFCNLYLHDTLLGTTDRIPRSTVATTTIPAPSAIDSGDRFGNSVAASGVRFAVGVPNDDNARGSNAGKVAVYRMDGDTPVLEQEILPPAGMNAVAFGASVALDGGLLAVGAPGEAAGAKGNALRAAIFERLGAQWTIKHTVDTSTGTASDQFGLTVALAGGMLAVGAPGDAQGEAAGSGAVYTYATDGGALITKIKPMVPSPGGGFGSALAMNAGALVVGAPGSQIQGAATGLVSLYQRVGQNLSHLGDATSSSAVDGDGFGTAVSISGDQMAVGAPGTDGSQMDQGAVYLFDTGGSLTAETARLEQPSGDQNGRFGASLLQAADGILVGAPGANSGNGVNGLVFRFNRDRVPIGQIVPEAGQSGLGASLAGSSSLVIVGAPDSNTGAGAGSILFDADRRLRDGFE